MAFYTFSDQTGFFAHSETILPPSPQGQPFLWGFACSGCLDNNIITFLTGLVQTFTAEDIVLFKGGPSGLLGFVGEGGKLYDNDGNYFQSYQSGESFTVSGHVFPSHHNYFYGETEESAVLINNNCSRTTGTINSFYILNVGLEDFSLDIAK